MHVVAQAGNWPALLRAVEEHQPDVPFDIRMPPTQTTEGIHAALRIRQQFLAVGILLLSTYTQIDEAVELLTSTASRVGYLLKDSVADLDELTSALTRISEGGTVFDPKLVAELLGRTRQTDPLDALTPRERQVLALMAEGQSNARITKTIWVPMARWKARQAHLPQARNPGHPRHLPSRPRGHLLPRRPVALPGRRAGSASAIAWRRHSEIRQLARSRKPGYPWPDLVKPSPVTGGRKGKHPT